MHGGFPVAWAGMGLFTQRLPSCSVRMHQHASVCRAKGRGANAWQYGALSHVQAQDFVSQQRVGGLTSSVLL